MALPSEPAVACCVVSHGSVAVPNSDVRSGSYAGIVLANRMLDHAQSDGRHATALAGRAADMKKGISDASSAA
jgi:hypothetical protein